MNEVVTDHRFLVRKSVTQLEVAEHTHGARDYLAADVVRNFSPSRIVERYTNKIAIAPDQPTLSDGVKVIERQFKIHRLANLGYECRRRCSSYL